MKTSTKAVKNESVKSESVLKRTKATMLDISMLAETIRSLKTDAGRDLESSQNRIQLLDEKIAAADSIMESIGHNIGQVHQVVLSVKETLDTQTGELSAALQEAEQEHHDRYAAVDDRMNAIGELIRSIDERTTQRYEAIQNRVQALEDRIPQLEADAKSLGDNVDSIERFQHKINARIMSVMKMSLMIIGVLVVTTIVLGWIFYKI